MEYRVRIPLDTSTFTCLEPCSGTGGYLSTCKLVSRARYATWDEKLSLTEIVWEHSPPGDSEGSNHSAHPAFSAPALQPSTPYTFRVHSPTFDQRASFTPPSFNRSAPSDGLYGSGGTRPSEFWDEIYAVDGRGYSSGTTNKTYPSLMNTSGLPRVTDERFSTTRATTITAHLGTALNDSSACAGSGEQGFGTSDLALSNDLSGFDIDRWTPDYLLATELETASVYNNGAHSIMAHIVQWIWKRFQVQQVQPVPVPDSADLNRVIAPPVCREPHTAFLPSSRRRRWPTPAMFKYPCLNQQFLQLGRRAIIEGHNVREPHTVKPPI
jgi:hypothetical protein